MRTGGGPMIRQSAGKDPHFLRLSGSDEIRVGDGLRASDGLVISAAPAAAPQQAAAYPPSSQTMSAYSTGYQVVPR